MRDLWVLMAELATDPENHHKLTPGATLVTPEMVDAPRGAHRRRLRAVRSADRVRRPRRRTGVAALLDVARTVVRRAERDAVAARRPEALVVVPTSIACPICSGRSPAGRRANRSPTRRSIPSDDRPVVPPDPPGVHVPMTFTTRSQRAGPTPTCVVVAVTTERRGRSSLATSTGTCCASAASRARPARSRSSATIAAARHRRARPGPAGRRRRRRASAGGGRRSPRRAARHGRRGRPRSTPWPTASIEAAPCRRSSRGSVLGGYEFLDHKSEARAATLASVTDRRTDRRQGRTEALRPWCGHRRRGRAGPRPGQRARRIADPGRGSPGGAEARRGSRS